MNHQYKTVFCRGESAHAEVFSPDIKAGGAPVKMQGGSDHENKIPQIVSGFAGCVYGVGAGKY